MNNERQTGIEKEMKQNVFNTEFLQKGTHSRESKKKQHDWYTHGRSRANTIHPTSSHRPVREKSRDRERRRKKLSKNWLWQVVFNLFWTNRFLWSLLACAFFIVFPLSLTALSVCLNVCVCLFVPCIKSSQNIHRHCVQFWPITITQCTHTDIGTRSLHIQYFY